MTEVRITSPSGGQKGQKPCRLGAVDPLALIELGNVAGMGEQKYDRFNYLKGYAWSLNIDAALRHLLAFASGEERDPESGLLHTAHAMWHMGALTSFQLRSIGEDDRAPKPAYRVAEYANFVSAMKQAQELFSQGYSEAALMVLGFSKAEAEEEIDRLADILDPGCKCWGCSPDGDGYCDVEDQYQLTDCELGKCDCPDNGQSVEEPFGYGDGAVYTRKPEATDVYIRYNDEADRWHYADGSTVQVGDVLLQQKIIREFG